MKPVIGIVVMAVLIAAHLGHAQANDDATKTYRLIAERLSVMKSVAAWKRENQVAVEDIEREKVVISRASLAAAESGIQPQSIVAFFAAQIEAAKVIQSCWLQRWQDNSEDLPSKTPDLVLEIRPELLRLGDEIVLSISRAIKADTPLGLPSGSIYFGDLVCLGAADIEKLMAGLAGVQPLASE
jgi:chorismate mutase-like protein